MHVSDLAATGALVVNWPTLFDGVFAREGVLLEESETCKRKCTDGRQCAGDPRVGEHTCVHGMSYFVSKVSGSTVTVFGVRGPSNRTPLNRYTGDGLKGRSLDALKIGAWVDGVQALLNYIEKDFLQRQSEMLDPLHDPIRLAKQINTIANKLVQLDSTGATFDKRIENASIELKTLVKAADLLSDSFDLLSIYFNPESASFGPKTAISLHGLLTKLVAIFRIDDGGITRSNARIYLSGSSYRNVFVHESFKLIPFALLSNAVKYCMIGGINVTLYERPPVIEIAIESTGPLIEEGEKVKIFAKKGRGVWAAKYVEGRGVGLYLAAIIAQAHNTRINVSSVPTGERREGIPLARTRFSVEVPISA